eukprot:gb/GFBE01052035.1/.p1 GENE.gb/GFBE01052035.1/~~gb/GFBE01052035.1/.p1  ORF type:complete len:237 (+),score=48.83 gb/GFBE01052035.1/:1-711(+)
MPVPRQVDSSALVMEGSEGEELMVQAPSTSRITPQGVTLFGIAAVALGTVAFVSLRQTPALRSGKAADAIGFFADSYTPPDGWVNLGYGTACRANSTDTALQPDQGEIKRGVNSLAECVELCTDDDCHGVEFWQSKDYCEVWREPIGYHRHVDFHATVVGASDFTCMLKNPSCDTLKVHQKVFTTALIELNEYHSKHCPQPLNDGSKCSIQYSETVDKAAHSLCNSVKAACNVDEC